MDSTEGMVHRRHHGARTARPCARRGTRLVARREGAVEGLCRGNLRHSVERMSEMKAAALFGATSIVAAITVGAMLVANWGAGRLDNRIEWVFWAGAIL